MKTLAEQIAEDINNEYFVERNDHQGERDRVPIEKIAALIAARTQPLEDALRALVAEQECGALPIGARCPRVKCATCAARAALAAKGAR